MTHELGESVHHSVIRDTFVATEVRRTSDRHLVAQLRSAFFSVQSATDTVATQTYTDLWEVFYGDR